MASDNTEKLNTFLSDQLLLENDALAYVSKKLTPHFESIPNSLMEEFMELAQDVKLTPISQQSFHTIGENDATIAAPEAHRIVFENAFLRILMSTLHPKQLVPFHTHQWDSIILTTQGSTFKCDDGNNVIVEDWPPMVEKVEGSFHAHQFQNIGHTTFHALVFEFKN